MFDLRQTIDDSSVRLTLDESLRRQMSNLMESLQIMNAIMADQQDEFKVYAINVQVLSLLQDAYSHYQIIREKIDDYRTQLENTKKNLEDELMINLLDLGNQSDEITDYALYYEKLTGSRHWTMGKTACGSTARALIYYFAKKNMLLVDFKKEVQKPKEGVRTLIAQLIQNKGQKGKGFLYFCDSERLDHAFIIQQTSQGHYRLFQSFIDQYSLAAHFAQKKYGNDDMNFDQIIAFCQELDNLVNAEKWNEKIANSYKHLFLSSPKDYVRFEFAKAKKDFSLVTLPYQAKNMTRSGVEKVRQEF
jgi:hypothetical protein